MMPFARAALLSLLFAAAATAAEKGLGLPKNSPFMPAGTAAAPAEAASERIEFAGVSSVGKKTDLIFYDKTAKKSHWIGLGETKEGIAVLTYDEQREQAVVKVNGVEKVLSLRKGVRTGGTPRPVATLPAASGFAIPAPLPADSLVQKIQPPPPPDGSASSIQPSSGSAAPAQPAKPTTPEAQAQVKAETEARMLVSDLLEIGMAQRKAYEEAQRKAAASGGQPQVVPVPAETPKP
jgi:hypothetical protein